MSAVVTEKCRQIACGFEVSYTDAAMIRRVLDEHLATAHGIGRVRGAESHLGCILADCDFKVSGSTKFTQDLLRDHLTNMHGIDPGNPAIPEEDRRGTR